MKPKLDTLSRPIRLSALLVALSLSAYSLQPASAASYSWIKGNANPPANESLGGDWDTTSPNWDAGAGAAVWANGNEAVFTNNTFFQTITVKTNVVASQFTISGGGTFRFTGTATNNTMDVPIIQTSAASADINSKITGSHGLNKTGAGRITFTVAADYTGNTLISGGNGNEIYASINNALPTTSSLEITGGTGNSFTLFNGRSQEITGLLGNGSVVGRLGSNTLTIKTLNAVTTTFTGALKERDVSVGQILNLVVTGSGTQVLNGTGNTFVGTTTVSGGTLLLGSNLTGSSVVNINGGSLKSNVANVILGVGAVTMSSGDINPGDVGTARQFTLAAGQDFTTTGGTIKLDLGTGFDVIAGSGAGSNFSLTNTTLALNQIAGFNYANTYQILSGFVDPGVVSGLSFTGYDSGAYTAALSNAGVLSFGAIPEPSTLVMLLGGLGLVAMRRRR